MKTDDYGIPVIDCDNAADLLNELDETNARWKGKVWIYRGQNDMTYRLLPPTLRDRFFKKHPIRAPLVQKGKEYEEEKIRDAVSRNDARDPRYYNLKEQVRLETVYVQSFTQLAELVGLAIPSDRYQISNLANVDLPSQSEGSDLRGRINAHGNPNAIRYALAQHHRIPTRLLDWTYRPQIAAYFAAQDDESNRLDSTSDQNGRYLVVWAVRKAALKGTSLHLVTHPGSQIDFMRAQEGVFVYDYECNWNYMKWGEWRPLEHQLARIVKDDAVYKLRLSYSKRMELSQLLRLKRASKAFLMPTFDNVADDFLSNPLAWITFFEE